MDDATSTHMNSVPIFLLWKDRYKGLISRFCVLKNSPCLNNTTLYCLKCVYPHREHVLRAPVLFHTVNVKHKRSVHYSTASLLLLFTHLNVLALTNRKASRLYTMPCGAKFLTFSISDFSGLDTVTTTQCLELLKDLAKQGRTVVCTLHQPSSTLFHMLDHVYFVANGYCIYQGAPSQLVPFLANVGLICKPTYNPADYSKCENRMKYKNHMLY